MRNKSLGRDCDPSFYPRDPDRFQIGPNSSVRKVQRWINRGGGVRPLALLDVLTARHVHPRSLRSYVTAASWWRDPVDCEFTPLKEH